MKTIPFVLCLLCSSSFLFSQDLSNATLEAHYTLLETAEDELNNEGDIMLINAPFMGADGVYSYGGYINDIIDTDSSLIESPNIEVINDTTFAIQVEVKFDSLFAKPAMVIGNSWRYLGFTSRYDSTFAVIHNGGEYETGTDKIETDRWYTLTVVHHALSSTSKYYVDNELIFIKEGILDHPQNDIRISNTHFGSGQAFRGFWRNLKIFSGSIITSTDIPAELISIWLSPIPSSSFIYINGDIPDFSRFIIYNSSGKEMFSAKTEHKTININSLQNGSYILQILQSNKIIATKKFVKN